METQPSNGSERKRIAAVAAGFIASLALVAALDFSLSAAEPSDGSYEHALKVRLSADRIYLLGNSIFKTGIDLDDLEAQLGSETGVDFEEHVGHYTNLWYLMVKNALSQSDRPRLLVWGFRPTYARQPAFRQRRSCDLERFMRGSEPFYDQMTSDTLFFPEDEPLRAWLVRYSHLQLRSGRVREGIRRSLQQWGLSLMTYLGGAGDHRPRNRACRGTLALGSDARPAARGRSGHRRRGPRGSRALRPLISHRRQASTSLVRGSPTSTFWSKTASARNTTRAVITTTRVAGRS